MKLHVIRGVFSIVVFFVLFAAIYLLSEAAEASFAIALVLATASGFLIQPRHVYRQPKR